METYNKLSREFIAFRSISADPSCREEMRETSEWLLNLFAHHSFSTKMYEGYGNPIVVASYEVDSRLPTYLIYGHYDVQPARMEDGWSSDPFVLTERADRLYARGAADNKGQVLVHMASVFDLIKRGSLKANVKFLIEGDEETGSMRLRQFMGKYHKILAADCVIISDGDRPNFAPALEAGFRGTFNVDVVLATSTTDLHSGLFGGAVPNAAGELAKLLSSLRDFKLEPLGKLKPTRGRFSQSEYCTLTGCKKVFVSSWQDLVAKTGLSAAVEITGLTAGYTGEGFRNSIPSRASAKVNVRIPPGKEPSLFIKNFTDYLRRRTPRWATLDITINSATKGALLETDNIYAHRAAEALTEVYGVPPINKYSGGSLPIVTDFQEVLGVPQVMIPLANEDCGMHAANENYRIADIKKALAFSKKFFGSV